MAIASAPRLWTFEDFCERIPEGLKADLVEGVIHVASPELPEFATNHASSLL
jgi:hypothetical protein